MEIIPDKEEVEIDAFPLAIKSPRIIDWKIYKEGKKNYYQIIRADRKTQMYMVFSKMLESFDREDLVALYNLVKAKFKSTRPMEDLDLLLWGDLKTMFEPHVEDETYMLVDKTYPLTPPTLTMMLEKKLQIDYQSKMAYQLLKLIKKQLKNMDWFSKYHVVIVCDEKIVRMPYGNEILMIQGDISDGRNESRLNIISCTKTKKYIEICIDYMELNKLTVKNRYPVPRIDDLFNQWQGSSVHSKINLRSSYHQLKVCEEDIPKTAFKTHYGYYEFQVIQFGLTNAPMSKKEHEEHLKLILELLKKEEFQGIHVDPAKIESIKDWEASKTPTKIRQFLGLVGYYRRFIEEKKEAAFQLLKQKLCSAPIMALPEGTENFVVYYDASQKEGERGGRCLKPEGTDKVTTSSSLSHDN
nr:putative reverse transcriptase domain-containing protein [Tanacetum cinerariifolium]